MTARPDSALATWDHVLVLWGQRGNSHQMRTLLLARGTRAYCEMTWEYVKQHGLGGPVIDEIRDPRITLIEADKWDALMEEIGPERQHPFAAQVVRTN